MTNIEETNLNVVNGAYEAYGRGDIEHVLGVQDTHVVAESPGPPDIPWAGTHHGPDGMGRFFSAIDAASEVQAFEATSFIASGDQVIVMGTEKVRAKRTGRSYETHWIHAMTLKNGKIFRWREYVDTAAVAAAFRE
jgi:ketosteroid isomerase-like protein